MKRLREEEGLALVPALAVLVIVLMLGSAVLATVNSQSSQSGAERREEGSFQVAESALNSQVELLSRTWPQTAATAYVPCTQSATPSAKCMGTALTTNYTSSTGGSGPNAGSDFAATPGWTTRVLDDVGAAGSTYYDDAIASQPGVPAWDANANGKVWVRSQATVGGRSSAVVSLVEQGLPVSESLPSATIVAGWFETTNNGKKVIVDAKGNSATAGNVSIRCSTPEPSRDDGCLGYDPRKGQLSPADVYQTGYVDGTAQPNATNRSSLGEEALARLKARAQSLGSYFPAGSCPPTLTGALIYVENANCSYTSNSDWNSATAPGVVIFGSGTLSISGTTTFYGLIYMANGQGLAPASGPCPSGPIPTEAYHNVVVSLGGTTTIVGSIQIDKCGGVFAGASGVNIVFDANVFANVQSNGAVAGVKNTFRVVPSL